ncbi:amino acid ABC transporter permease [Lachnospiraceae bacterium MD1]|jgi:putative glutamine transport system permease protein|uniref:Amino acid ABC transporter permease n=1 Tax=Variimorphobacter saccharofermentans TaxID=2755051 RepID=A0A839K1G6_9FIRM|nr:amino acid ABC transporter permease [Variimorphobacter saccharofermentans]MBB2183480.1 amino acid ABC transporter permease [Variimorphobacter saccharofermentans]
MNTLGNSLSMLKNPTVLTYLLSGIAYTLIISVVAVGIGLLLGSILALVRNYCTSKRSKIFKWLATAYIEIFRNTPLLLWIFICLVFLPVPEFLSRKMFGLTSVEVKLLFKGSMTLILFTSSVIAEIVRGGLNSVAHGQFEAGHSQGFSTVQIMIYIVLPQAYRNIVPTLLSQIITTIKDSSYLANIAVIELMSRVKTLLSSANRYNGTGSINVSDVFVLFGFAAIIYFIINFLLSSLVRYIQKHPRIPKTTTRTS